MRVLGGTLETDQKRAGIPPLIKIVLTQGENTYTYTKSRIEDINHDEEPYSQKSTVLLDNSDKTLNDINFMGYKGVISRGVVTSGGEVYSPCPPQWVIPNQLDSFQGGLTCQLELIGIPDLMAEDRASGPYTPDDTDTKTVKRLIREIAGDSGVTMLPVYNHCTAYDIVFDSEDSLIDAFQPKDGFRIYTNSNRLAMIRELLDHTKCVMRAEDDGKLHIFVPTTEGDAYDYEWEFLVAGQHSFFSKAIRNTLVIPNYIVCSSNKDDYPQYSGSANDPTSYALLPKRQYMNTRLANDQQGADIAEARLSKYQLWSELGAISAPMNVGAEVFDFVQVTDSRQGDSRKGNLGHIHWHYNANKKEWRDNISFGGWLSIRKLSSDLTVYPDGLEQHIKEMFIENLYAQYIYAEMLDVEFLSAITANMGLLTAGEIRIGRGVLSPSGTATGGSQTTLEDSEASWTPSEWVDEDIRVVIDGVAYTRTISANTSTEITFAALPASIEVSSGDSYYLGRVTVSSGDDYYIRGVGTETASGGSTTTLVDTSMSWETDEHAGKQIRIIIDGNWYQRTIISNTSNTVTFAELPEYEPFTGFRLWAEEIEGEYLGRIAGFNEGVIQFYSGSDGYLYAGGGSVILNTVGVTLKGEGNGAIRFEYDDVTVAILKAKDVATLWLNVGSEFDFLIQAGTIITKGNVRPDVDDTDVLGTDTYQYEESHIHRGYFDTRLRIPGGAEGTDLYDTA